MVFTPMERDAVYLEMKNKIGLRKMFTETASQEK